MKSYPFGDSLKWRSPDAACRCLPRQRAAHGYTFSSKNHAKKNRGTCDGCEECAYSFPSDDPLRFNSAEKMFRCRPESKLEFNKNGNCGRHYNGECGQDCHLCKWSWPEGADGTPANGGACRCADIKDITFGQHCLNKDEGECGNSCKDC